MNEYGPRELMGGHNPSQGVSPPLRKAKKIKEGVPVPQPVVNLESAYEACRREVGSKLISASEDWGYSGQDAIAAIGGARAALNTYDVVARNHPQREKYAPKVVQLKASVETAEGKLK